MPDVKIIFPVIVLYRTHLREAQTYRSLLCNDSFTHFMIYDNSPEDHIVDTRLLDRRAVYVRDTKNSGLSHAYNYAGAYARQEGYTHLLILDQDTTFPPHAAEVYQNIASTCPLSAPSLHIGEKRPFSPVDVKGWTLKGVCLPPGEYPLTRFSPVNSGICVRLDLFNQAGGYDENVKLDYADFVFSRRLSPYHSVFRLLPFVAHQDFSDNVTDTVQLLRRLRLYLNSATNIRTTSFMEKAKIVYQTFRHTLSIGFRTRSLSPLTSYVRHFILKHPI